MTDPTFETREAMWPAHLLNLIKRAREYVEDSLDAHEHSDGRDLLNEIDEALKPDAGYCFNKSAQVLQSELDAAKAEIERLRGAMKRAADIVDRNLGRQNEKVGDASYVLRQALGDSHV